MGLFGSNKKEEKSPARTVIEDVCHAKKGESILIIANPETNIIAQNLFTEAVEAGCNPTLVYQRKKSIMDNTEPAVVGAIKSEPDIVLSISACKLGKDREAIAVPFKDSEGNEYTSTFDYLLYGKKSIRAIWTPGLTEDIFNRTVLIDYKQLNDRCRKLCNRFNNAVSVHVTSPNGTDVTVPVAGRLPMTDNGDFSTPGSGGNIPAGEVFISPLVSGINVIVSNPSQEDKLKDEFEQAKEKLSKVNLTRIKDVEEAASVVGGLAKEITHVVADTVSSSGSGEAETQVSVSVEGTCGVIVFDGSMSFSDGDAMLETPITCKVEKGFVTEISGGEEAKRLIKDITAAEKQALAMENSGELPKGQGSVYSRNARNIGELGIGLNPAANITGNMLEDEKAFHTCHFAIGQNYDGDGPALIHLDGIVRNPTIVIKYADGKEYKVLDVGELKL